MTQRTLIVALLCLSVVGGSLLWIVYRTGTAAALIDRFRPSWRPATDFADTPPPAAPDYADLSNWMAHPDLDDLADQLPQALPQTMAQTDVDVFWVHPTTYFESDHWNQPLDLPRSTDHLLLQASLFSSCCQVYSPTYRQATLYAFYELWADGADALDLAYQDIEAAFLYYIEHENDGRPFILAGHSQGTHHLDRLIRDVIAPSELVDQLVVAYLVGYHVHEDNGIPVCETATQTGCKVSWNSQSPTVAVEEGAEIDLCVNPLSWSTSKAAVSATENLGTIHLLPGEPYPFETEVADAQCGEGALLISEINSTVYAELLGEAYFHDYDYSLFYENVRQNSFDRIDSYLAGK